MQNNMTDSTDPKYMSVKDAETLLKDTVMSLNEEGFDIQVIIQDKAGQPLITLDLVRLVKNQSATVILDISTLPF